MDVCAAEAYVGRSYKVARSRCISAFGCDQSGLPVIMVLNTDVVPSNVQSVDAKLRYGGKNKGGWLQLQQYYQE